MNISFLIIPLLNDGKDLFIFSSWKLFSLEEKRYISDISWDNGKTFLFRDERDFLIKNRIDQRTLFNLVLKNNMIEIRNQFSETVVKRHSSPPKLFIFRGNIFSHIILKEKLVEIDRMSF